MRPSPYAAAAGLSVSLALAGYLAGWPRFIGFAVMAVGVAAAGSALLKVGIPRRQLVFVRWMWKGIPGYGRAAWVVVSIAVVATHVWALRAMRFHEALLSVNGVYFAVAATLIAWAYERVGPPVDPKAFTKVRAALQRRAIREIRDYWAYRWYLIGLRAAFGGFAAAVLFSVLLGCSQWQPLLVPIFAALGVAGFGWLAMMFCFVPMQIWVRRKAPDMTPELRRQMFRDLL